MSQSNDHWGDVAEHDDELAQAWDSYRPLPDAGTDDALDAFVAAKHLTIPALVRLGARLTDQPGVLAFALPGGIKYRNVETGDKWSYAGSTWHALKIVRAGGTPADTVLVAEGETDSARLSLLYPDCDVAINPAGAKRWTAAFTRQLAEYQRVVVCLDSDTAGNEGAAKIQAALPHAVRLTPPPNPDNDWCGLPADVVPPPLPDAPDVGEVVGGLRFTDLATLLEEGVPEPEVLVDDLLYREGVHLVSGHPASGKTTLVYMLAHMVMAEAGHVVVFDFESGIRQTVRRLDAMAIPGELVRDQFHYAGWPDKPEEHLAAVSARWPGALVVVDSLSKALAQQGINENDNSEVTEYTARVVRACKENDLPVVIIDHITKDGERSDYSRGAGAKLADVDVHWRVIKEEEFNRTKAGRIAVIQKKDREGYFPFATWWEVGDGRGNLTLVPGPPPEEEDAEEDATAPAI